MQVIKRDGSIAEYDRAKITIAIGKANAEVEKSERVSKEEIEDILDYIESKKKKRMLVEDIQDIIEEKMMEQGHFELAKTYISTSYALLFGIFFILWLIITLTMPYLNWVEILKVSTTNAPNISQAFIIIFSYFIINLESRHS